LEPYDETLVVRSYKSLKELRVWKKSIGDDGVVSLTNLLNAVKEKIPLAYFGLIDIGLSIQGALFIRRTFLKMYYDQ